MGHKMEMRPIVTEPGDVGYFVRFSSGDGGDWFNYDVWNQWEHGDDDNRGNAEIQDAHQTPEVGEFREGFEDDIVGNNPNPAVWYTGEYTAATVNVVDTKVDTDAGPVEMGIGNNELELSDQDTSKNCYIKRSLSSMMSGYYSAWYRFNENTTTHYALYTHGSQGSAYWLQAKANGKWGNASQDFTDADYKSGTWYFVEMVFDFYDGVYSVWIDGAQKLDRGTIHGSEADFGDWLYITPATISTTGRMWVDNIVLVDHATDINEIAVIKDDAIFKHGFEDDWGNPTDWTTFENEPDATVTVTTYLPPIGQRNLKIHDDSASKSAAIRRSINDMKSGYFSAWYKFFENDKYHPIMYSYDGQTSTYLVSARANGKWGNGSTDFTIGDPGTTTSYSAWTWYHVEMVFDYDHAEGKYWVWVDGELVADAVDIPGTATEMTGYIYINAATVTGTGGMYVDEIILVDGKDKLAWIGDLELSRFNY